MNQIITKSELYIHRLLTENPTHTKSGIPLEILEDGHMVRTYSGRSRNGEYSVYGPCDYPNLFGWFGTPATLPQAMPWPYGTKVVVKGVHPDARGGNIGKIVSFRYNQNGTLDYRITRWRNNSWWINETGLELHEEPALLGTHADLMIFEEHNTMSENIEPTLEERVAMIEKHLGIKITRRPSELVIEQEEHKADEED